MPLSMSQVYDLRRSVELSPPVRELAAVLLAGSHKSNMNHEACKEKQCPFAKAATCTRIWGHKLCQESNSQGPSTRSNCAWRRHNYQKWSVMVISQRFTLL